MMFLLAYNDRYKDKEKYVISASGDSFFMVDDSRYYFDELSGSKHLRWGLNTYFTRVIYI